MNITDVPQSGIYYQQGAVVRIVVQFIDNATGLPIPLQTASGMAISILYPDGVTAQTFQASLFTDGSDGNIVYTTKNNGSNVDLSQIGLYQLQGSASVNGVALPPSYLTDFYVLRNVAGLSTTPIFNSSALILFDPLGNRWGVTVSTLGALVVALTPTLPTNYLKFNQLVMQDANGVYWTVGVNSNGTFNTAVASGSGFAHALANFILSDANGVSWVVTISTAGVLSAA